MFVGALATRSRMLGYIRQRCRQLRRAIPVPAALSCIRLPLRSRIGRGIRPG
jgi:hypothetical protein